MADAQLVTKLWKKLFSIYLPQRVPFLRIEQEREESKPFIGALEDCEDRDVREAYSRLRDAHEGQMPTPATFRQAAIRAKQRRIADETGRKWRYLSGIKPPDDHPVHEAKQNFIEAMRRKAAAEPDGPVDWDEIADITERMPTRLDKPPNCRWCNDSGWRSFRCPTDAPCGRRDHDEPRAGIASHEYFRRCTHPPFDEDAWLKRLGQESVESANDRMRVDELRREHDANGRPPAGLMMNRRKVGKRKRRHHVPGEESEWARAAAGVPAHRLDGEERYVPLSEDRERRQKIAHRKREG